MKKVDPTARVILHNCGFHYVSEDIDKIIDLVVVLDKDKLSWEEKDNVRDPLENIEEQIDYQYAIFPIVLTKNEWVHNNMPTPLYNTVMNHENGTVLC
jgi:hypothetical protein